MSTRWVPNTSSSLARLSYAPSKSVGVHAGGLFAEKVPRHLRDELPATPK
jgi:hypothetical protein